MNPYLTRWKQRASELRVEVHALYLAYRDPRVPWLARAVAAGVVAYALSPIDLIPDPIPVLGILDDLLLVPLGAMLAIKLIPPDVLAECQSRAREASGAGLPVSLAGAAVIVALWVLLVGLTVAGLYRLLQR